MGGEILTIKEVAKYLKVTERTLYRLVQDGQIPAFKVGASWRFKRTDIDTWIEAQKISTMPRSVQTSRTCCSQRV